jgi:hypothetical protein
LLPRLCNHGNDGVVVLRLDRVRHHPRLFSFLRRCGVGLRRLAWRRSYHFDRYMLRGDDGVSRDTLVLFQRLEPGFFRWSALRDTLWPIDQRHLAP